MLKLIKDYQNKCFFFCVNEYNGKKKCFFLINGKKLFFWCIPWKKKLMKSMKNIQHIKHWENLWNKNDTFRLVITMVVNWQVFWQDSAHFPCQNCPYSECKKWHRYLSVQPTWLRAPLKPLGTILLWSSSRFMRAGLHRDPMMPKVTSLWNS